MSDGFTTYVWRWSNKNVNIRTMFGQDAAVQKAIAYFPNDAVSQEYILNTPPLINPDDGAIPEEVESDTESVPDVVPTSSSQTS